MTIAKYRTQPAFISPFNELMNEFLGRDIGQFFGSDDTRRSMPGVNIVERENDYELRMLAPGFSKEDMKLRVENDVLTISAEKKNEELKENERYTRREFTHSAFSRSFSLPETVKVEEIRAEFKNGVLHLSIPKAEQAKPRTREISIQ
jgi:HSP20 family protein